MKKTSKIFTRTLFPDGIPFDYLTNFTGRNPWPKPTYAIIIKEAVKNGYNVLHINLEK